MKFVNVRINGFTFHLWAYDSNYIHRILLDNKIEFQNIGSHDTDILPTTVYTLDEFIGLVRRTFPNHSTKKETSMLTSQINNKEKIIVTKPFPKIMKYNNGEFVILASIQQGDHISGTVIKTDDPDYKLGDVDTFSPKAFQDWEGSITLTQD